MLLQPALRWLRSEQSLEIRLLSLQLQLRARAVYQALLDGMDGLLVRQMIPNVPLRRAVVSEGQLVSLAKM